MDSKTGTTQANASVDAPQLTTPPANASGDAQTRAAETTTSAEPLSSPQSKAFVLNPPTVTSAKAVNQSGNSAFHVPPLNSLPFPGIPFQQPYPMGYYNPAQPVFWMPVSPPMPVPVQSQVTSSMPINECVESTSTVINKALPLPGPPPPTIFHMVRGLVGCHHGKCFPPLTRRGNHPIPKPCAAACTGAADDSDSEKPVPTEVESDDETHHNTSGHEGAKATAPPPQPVVEIPPPVEVWHKSAIPQATAKQNDDGAISPATARPAKPKQPCAPPPKHLLLPGGQSTSSTVRSAKAATVTEEQHEKTGQAFADAMTDS